MSASLSSPPAMLETIFNTIHLGLIVVDTQQVVRLWNGWVEKHSGVPADTALGKHIHQAFIEAPSKALIVAINNTLHYGLSSVLSNALHRSPLALFDRQHSGNMEKRIHQSITLTPLQVGAERYCLIQITDPTTSIKREKILRSQSELLKKEATTDSLTGIYNRRFFDEHYKMALGHAKRHSTPLAVFMIDIDFFKEYNDHYGHVAGDKALINVAATLRQQLLRASDVAARFGGEEFIIMLPNMSQENAVLFAEKIRTAVWNLNIPHEKSRIAERLTISIGFSDYPRSCTVDPQKMLHTADAALYEAKKTGRNRSCYMPLEQTEASIAEASIQPEI
jgi:diguanylate cyclase (GGDEF)-like protein